MSEQLTDAELSAILISIWTEVLSQDVGPDDNFFALGGSSIDAVRITNRLQIQVDAVLHPTALFDAPTVAQLVAWYREHHPEVFGIRDAPFVLPGEPLSPAQIARARSYFRGRHASPNLSVETGPPSGPPPIFILCPPRSGSTLLRVMLGGHPQLFAPPELYLLGFNTLRERDERFSGRLSFLAEGLVRALMAAEDLEREEAEANVAQLVERGASTREVYARLHAAVAPRRLIDKTPSYALHPTALRRAEAEFEGAFFIHLARHPLACAASFAELRADLATGEQDPALPKSGLARGELWWHVATANILDFLATVPPERQHRLHFEALVREPETELRQLSAALGLEFEAPMLTPHVDSRARMSDGITPDSRMLGDQKFHHHSRIEANVAERWRERIHTDFLAPETWALATTLGYVREDLAAPDEDERESWEF